MLGWIQDSVKRLYIEHLTMAGKCFSDVHLFLFKHTHGGARDVCKPCYSRARSLVAHAAATDGQRTCTSLSCPAAAPRKQRPSCSGATKPTAVCNLIVCCSDPSHWGYRAYRKNCRTLSNISN
jgi:hypothetical protein